MKWKKLGRIFCPSGQFPWMWSYAATPVAEPLRGNVYRVFFSSRDNRQRSHVGYVDINLDHPTRILNLSRKPVLAPGPPGRFDDSGTMLSWICHNRSQRFYYYVGWSLAVAVPFRNAIGLALGSGASTRLKKFSDGPIVDRGPVDPAFVASCCVLKEKGKWRMWYLSCVGWEIRQGALRHRYHLKYAESQNGIQWDRDGRICIDFKNSGEYAISKASVLKEGRLYKMWYSYRGEKYRIGYAESMDGIRWKRKDREAGIDVSKQGWDSEMIEYPFVFDHRGKRYLLYNGNGYGRTGFGIAILENG